MYDTEKRIELVKKRMYEYHRRQERRTVRRLSVLCTLLFLSLVGAMGIMQSRPINATGMYGTILLHEGAGGYVLVAATFRSLCTCAPYLPTIPIKYLLASSSQSSSTSRAPNLPNPSAEKRTLSVLS